MKENSKLSQFSSFLLSSTLWFGRNLIMTKTSKFFSIHQENTCKSSLHLNLIILTFFHSFTVNEDKLQNLSIWRFLLRSGYVILVIIWKWLKLLNTFPFIKKTLVNHLYIRIWWFWLTFTVFQWMLKISEITQLSSFLLRSRNAI